MVTTYSMLWLALPLLLSVSSFAEELHSPYRIVSVSLLVPRMTFVDQCVTIMDPNASRFVSLTISVVICGTDH